MSPEREYHVTLRYARGYEFVAEFNDTDGVASMLLDEPPPLGEGRGPNAAAVLSAAVGNCLAASLLFCLKKARVEVSDLTAHVTTQIARNENGRFRISGIGVQLNPELREADPGRISRCEELFEDFCMVTESVRHGIPVHVTLGPADSDSLGKVQASTVGALGFGLSALEPKALSPKPRAQSPEGRRAHLS